MLDIIMKKILTFSLAISLSGCAFIESFQMAKYDPSEYSLITSISSLSEVGGSECSDPSQMKTTAYQLLLRSTEFKNYTNNIPNNQESIRMSTELFTIVKGLTDRYSSGVTVSTAYCTNKMSIIERAAKTIQTAIGTKPR